ncbi:MAG: hypothetical protein DMF90_07620 [Acidobacteria bacterium]|nr:MAG: hypothetical protein DMF90_07620 [Acidobacteriota bacterium]
MLASGGVGEHTLLVLAIVPGEFGGIPRFPVHLDQATIRIIGVQRRVHLIHLDGTGRELPEFRQVQLGFALAERVLAEELRIRSQMLTRLGKKRLEIR